MYDSTTTLTSVFLFFLFEQKTDSGEQIDAVQVDDKGKVYNKSLMGHILQTSLKEILLIPFKGCSGQPKKLMCFVITSNQ